MQRRSALVQSRQVSCRKRSLNWASRISGTFSKRRGEVRIISGGKQTTNRTNWLEKRVCVSQYSCILARVKVLSASSIHYGNGGPETAPHWSWVSGEIKTCVSHKKKSKGHIAHTMFFFVSAFQGRLNKIWALYSFPKAAKKKSTIQDGLKQ